MDNKIADIGELVEYNGELHHAYDRATRSLMIDNLTVGDLYEVIRVVDYSGYGHMYYGIISLWFPCYSFNRINGRWVKLKYGLK